MRPAQFRWLISAGSFRLAFRCGNILCPMTTCDECGYDYESVPTDKLAGRLRDMGPRYREALGAAGPWAAGLRPAPTVWSALEYACHMRDVLLVQRDRAVVALVEDNPGFARMYRDERVELCRYSGEPLEDVLDELEMSARLCAMVFDGLEPAAWLARSSTTSPVPRARALTTWPGWPVTPCTRASTT